MVCLVCILSRIDPFVLFTVCNLSTVAFKNKKISMSLIESKNDHFVF